MMDAQAILKQAAQMGASDIFLIAGLPITYKVHNQIQRADEAKLMPQDTDGLLSQIYALASRSPDRMLERGDDDFSFSLPGCPATGPASTASGGPWPRWCG